MAKRYGKKKGKASRCKYCGVKLTKMYTQARTGEGGMKRDRYSVDYWTCTNPACAGKPEGAEPEGTPEEIDQKEEEPTRCPNDGTYLYRVGNIKGSPMYQCRVCGHVEFEDRNEKPEDDEEE